MKPKLVVAKVTIDSLRRVLLPQGQLPCEAFAAGRAFEEMVPGSRLLGVYSDPLLSTRGEAHEFVTAFLSVVGSTTSGDWFSETGLPPTVTARDLRILFDAFCFCGVALSR
ncbi:MAG: hypothetical protein HYR96_10240 [Deltaproteobacteria bacterium]|nr:hypothetical protein [Deltaproteobacteria bacterium]MBI3294345.1 hypothetical protein [Deltaproteobacteria bacterium]